MIKYTDPGANKYSVRVVFASEITLAISITTPSTSCGLGINKEQARHLGKKLLEWAGEEDIRLIEGDSF